MKMDSHKTSYGTFGSFGSSNFLCRLSDFEAGPINNESGVFEIESAGS
mgnify:FL=1